MLEKDKSEQSTTLQQSVDTKNYLSCIDQLRKQNQMKNKALKTAEKLIQKYCIDNQRLKTENQHFLEKIHYYEIVFREMSIDNNRKNLLTQYLDLSQADRSTNKNKQQNSNLAILIQKLLSKQQAYQEKVSILQAQILLLQRSSTRNDGITAVNKCRHDILTNFNPDRAMYRQSTYDWQSQHKSKQQQKNNGNNINKLYNNNKNKQSKLSQLRALHLKLKHTDNDCSEGATKKLGAVVSRIFSQQKLRIDCNYSEISETKILHPKNKQCLLTPQAKKNKSYKNKKQPVVARK